MSEADAGMTTPRWQQPGSADQLDFWYEHVWAEDIDYRAIEGAIDDRGPIRGRDQMRRYAEDWFQTLDGITLTPVEVLDAGGGKFVVALRVSGKPHGSDNQVEQNLFIVWTVGEDGKLARGREYATRDDALREAGLAVSDEQR